VIQPDGHAAPRANKDYDEASGVQLSPGWQLEIADANSVEQRRVDLLVTHGIRPALRIANIIADRRLLPEQPRSYPSHPLTIAV